jgi:hypothetical protein
LAYNRPTQVQELIETLRETKPSRILVAVDGPKETLLDKQLVDQVHEKIQHIDWTSEVKCLLREQHLGLHRSITDAVSWALSIYSEIIVLEDDVRPGPEFFIYMTECLTKYRDTENIAHISGYNIVSKRDQLFPSNKSRLSIYPASYAWGTWRDSWKRYEDDLLWARAQTLLSLRRITGSLAGAIVWKINFKNADNEVISTWKYRWTASMWKHNLMCLSPNVNIATYRGFDGGTHTRTKPKWKELKPASILELNEVSEPEYDSLADAFVSKFAHRATPFGVLRKIVESIVLRIIHRFAS